MKIDWFSFWLIFSGILLFFIFVGFMLRFFSWLNFRKELSFIKQNRVKGLIDMPTNFELDKSFLELSNFKQEVDLLKKDVYFGVIDKESANHSEDFGLDKLLDGKILNLIKEKDYLLEQKDMLIFSLEEKNNSSLKKIVNKAFFLVQEKDKILKEKDLLILKLKSKIKESENMKLEEYFDNLEKKQEHVQHKIVIDNMKNNPNEIINVNFMSGK